MSLTSHLEDNTSPIGQFLRQRFAQTQTLTREANRQLKAVPTIRPVLQTGETYPYTYLGTAVDYRIRYAFAITPFQGLVAWSGALHLAFRSAESASGPLIDQEELFAILRLTRVLPFDIMQSVVQGPYPFRLVWQFFERLQATLRDIQPVGRRLEPEAERTLDRYCLVLSLFEQAFRSDAYLQGPLMQPAVKQSVEELLAIAQDSWINDLGALFTLFYDRYQHLLSRPAILNPTFAGGNDVGGADADLIVDGCLIDIKTSIAPQVKAKHLYQLAGYLLLDNDDHYHITSVGIYMARQGLLFTWPVAEFLQKLTGESHLSLQALRNTFHLLCQHSIQQFQKGHS